MTITVAPFVSTPPALPARPPASLRAESVRRDLASLADLAVGDKVIIKRNLDHPAHMKQVACDSRNGSTTMFVRDPDVEELLGTTVITDRRHIPAIPGVGNWNSREEKTLVRLSNGFWYDCATGLQDGSGATLIERA